jgi:hypothetical protein
VFHSIYVDASTARSALSRQLNLTIPSSCRGMAFATAHHTTPHHTTPCQVKYFCCQEIFSQGKQARQALHNMPWQTMPRYSGSQQQIVGSHLERECHTHRHLGVLGAGIFAPNQASAATTGWIGMPLPTGVGLRGNCKASFKSASATAMWSKRHRHRHRRVTF